MDLNDDKNLGSDQDIYSAREQIESDDDYSTSDLEGDFEFPGDLGDPGLGPVTIGGGGRDELKRQAKRSAVNRLKKHLVDEPINDVLSGLAGSDDSDFDFDDPKNRRLVKARAKQMARTQVSKALEGVGGETFQKGLQTGLSGGFGKSAALGAKQLAKETAVQVGKKAGSGAVTAGLDAGVAGAGVAAAPETLGLSLLVALLLNIAISLGVGEAIECLIALKNNDLKQAKFHAIKAAALIGMFILLLLSLVMCLSVIGMPAGIPLLIALNIYAVLGLVFPETPGMQGLSRKWMMAILIVLDFFVVIIILAFLMGLAYGICTEEYIGSLLGWDGVVGSILKFVDNSQFGTGGMASALNEMCVYIQNVK